MCTGSGQCGAGEACACADAECAVRRCSAAACACGYNVDGDSTCDGVLASCADGSVCSLGEQCASTLCVGGLCRAASDVVVNYGLQLVYRSQDLAYDETCAAGMTKMCNTSTNPLPPTTKEQTIAPMAVNAFLFQPNVWMKLHYRALVVEFEGTAVLGRMDHGGILLDEKSSPLDPVTFRQFGAVLASELHLYRNALFIGLELGGASGDQAEERGHYLNYRWRFSRQPAGDRSLRDFVKACQDVHMPVVVRMGPWCHGEVRNGGLPEWILPMGRQLRTQDEKFLA